MPLALRPEIVEGGRVYRSKKKQEGDDEKQAMKELQQILAHKSRRACDCGAQLHELVENCLNCGRFTCSAEGPGKCMHCGNIVLTPDQRERLGKHVDLMQPQIDNKSKSGQHSRAGKS